MFTIDSSPQAIDVIAVLSTATSRCEIRKRVSDNEGGDLIDARCGSTVRQLGRALKGVSIDRISACRVVVTVNAVHRPRLLNLVNCSGSLTVTDVGSVWTKKLRQSVAIKDSSVEYVAYKALSMRPGCYKVAITYDAVPGSENTSYKERVGRFCVANR